MFLAMLTMTAAQGSALDFTYNFDNRTAEGMGYDKTETYDVAIFLNNPSFTGAAVTGISVDVPSEGIANPSAWLTSELKLKRKNGRYLNDPDIAVVEAVVSDGVLHVTFAEPYVIPAEGVYVGYSFDVTDLNTATSAPVSVVAGSDESGLFLHSSRTKTRWASQVSDTGKVSAMTVCLQGDFPDLAAYMKPGTMSAAAGSGFTADMTIVNGGYRSVSSVGYSYSAGEYSGTGTVTLPTPLAGGICRSAAVTCSFDAPSQTGVFDLDMKVTHIDGTPVECTSTAGKLEVYPFMPVNRPLVEEYTGTWCGWCPRGYVALELMKHTVGDLYIAAAYHSGDEMAFQGKTPNQPDGYPSGYYNRNMQAAFHNPMEEWQKLRTGLPDGEVYVSVKWTDDTERALSATAKTRFIRDKAKADYRIQFILVADGLSSPSWRQSNSFSGKGTQYEYMNNEFGRIFTEGSPNVSGLTFNDVAVTSTDKEGFPASVPASVEAGREYEFSYTFDLSDVDNADCLMAPDRLRVIAVLLDAGAGQVVNSNSSAYPDGSPFVGVSAPNTDADAVETARYAIDGTRLNAPVPGINIIRCSDGSVRKVLVK